MDILYVHGIQSCGRTFYYVRATGSHAIEDLFNAAMGKLNQHMPKNVRQISCNIRSNLYSTDKSLELRYVEVPYEIST